MYVHLYRSTRDECLFCVLLVPRRLAGRASSSTSEGLLVGSVIVCANAVTCRRSTLSTQLGPETLNIHAIFSCRRESVGWFHVCAWARHW